ncbi:hypothetical protein DPMN_122143 [Dreissena polymorpha]|uniref:Uncharacterized protein n=1 Tax=Dreissena polymorpha TaxID=45954 RepID=A0A9D4GUX3_DREPO|nr:hypothetical protein DPMN_122143 [Dreissena polymorpha]
MFAKKAVTIDFKPDTSITETVNNVCGLGKVSKIKQLSTENSTKQGSSYSEIQTNYVNKPGLVSNTASGSANQPDPDSENQNNDVNKPDLATDQNNRTFEEIATEYSDTMERNPEKSKKTFL